MGQLPLVTPVQPAAPLSLQTSLHLPVKPAAPLPVQSTTPLPIQPAAPLSAQPTTPLSVQCAAPLPVQPAAPLPPQPTVPVQSGTTLSAQSITSLPDKSLIPTPSQLTDSSLNQLHITQPASTPQNFNLPPEITPVPTPTTSSDADKSPARDPHPPLLPPNWKTASDEDGCVYYYHVITRWVLLLCGLFFISWLIKRFKNTGLHNPAFAGNLHTWVISLIEADRFINNSTVTSAVHRILCFQPRIFSVVVVK